MYDDIQNFGKNVLDYILSISKEGDTVLYAIDNYIYKYILFNNNAQAIKKFEQEIKAYVEINKLNFHGSDNIALALAAHQIILAYGENGDESKINPNLLSFYFPNKTDFNSLYSCYYEANNESITLQDKLWDKISTILESHNRFLIKINGNLREQKYIKSQLLILKSLKYQYFKIFYSAGLSPQATYTRDEFDTKMSEKILNDTVKYIGNIVKRNVDESFNFDSNILLDQLWSLYTQWDGEYPTNNFIAENDAYLRESNIYLEERYEDDDSEEASELIAICNPENHMSLPISHDNTKIDVNTGVNYRIFTRWDDWTWKMNTINFDIPSQTQFLLLVEYDSVNHFSKENQTELKLYGQRKNLYTVLKYSSKPENLITYPFDKDIISQANKSELIGGVKISNKKYLDIPGFRPTLLPKKESIQTSEMNISIDSSHILKKVSFTDASSNQTITYDLLPVIHNNNFFNSDNFAWGNLYLDLEKKYVSLETVQKEKDSYENHFILNLQDPIFSKVFKLEKVNTKITYPCIPYEEIYVKTGNDKFIHIDDDSSISKETKDLLKQGISFGEYPGIYLKDISNIYAIEYQLAYCINEKVYFKISNFTIKDAFQEEKIVGKNITRHILIGKSYPSDNKSIKKINRPIIKKEENYQFSYVNETFQNSFLENTFITPLEKVILSMQDALFQWLDYIEFATWKKIQQFCSTIIQNSDYYEYLKDYPEYKIFMPLFKLGFIEPCFNNNKCGYCISNKKGIVLNNESPYFYQNYFNTSNKKSVESLKNLSLDYLKSIPTIENTIKNNSVLFENLGKINCREQGYIKYSETNNYNKQLSKYAQNLSKQDKSFIYKLSEESYMDNYIYLQNSNSKYLIKRSNPDSLAFSYSYIQARRIDNIITRNKLFEYNPKNKTLLVYNMRDLPAVFIRALVLNDTDILKDNNIYLSYCKNHQKQVFSNVDRKLVEIIDKKFK